MKPLPPDALLKFFRWYCHPRLVYHIEGDLIEVYRRRRERMSARKANMKFFIDVMLLFRPGIIRPRQHDQHSNPYDMYRNYLTVCLRVFNREKMYSVINVAGLALGFTCCLLIYLFVSDELSYDKMHHDKDRIYRVASAYMRQGVWEPYATNSWRTADLIKSQYGEVEKMVRIMTSDAIFEYGDKRIVEDRIAWVEDNFFDVFSFPLVEGNAKDVLRQPNKVVIDETTAKKYFGSDNAIGKVFKVDDGSLSLQVSGVMKDMPATSHFRFNMLMSGETLRQLAPKEMLTEVGWDSQHVYVRLAPGTDPLAMEATFPAFINKNLGYFNSGNFKLFLQPLPTIHLQSNIGRELQDNGSMYRIYTFSVIALFILVIACVNYMNLTTARSMRRAKEVGMRKVLGAKRADLIGQFLTESFLMTGTALLLAILFSNLLLPMFNAFAGKEIIQSILFTPRIVTGLMGALIVIALVSGLYPALMLSSFQAKGTVKQRSEGMAGGLSLRKGLVVLQFAISIGLIAASTIVFQQWEYMKNKSLGINQNQVLAIPLQTLDRKQINTFRNELLKDPTVEKIGACNMRMPGWIGNSTPYKAQDVESDEEVNKSMKIIRIDHDFLSTVEAQIIAGRDFSRDFPSDSSAAMIINESAAAQLKWKDPVGKWMQLGDQKYIVVGLVKDFHFESLHREIPPTIFIYSTDVYWEYLRINTQNIPATLQYVKSVYSRFVTNRDFQYTFLKDDVERQYVGEQKFTQVFTLFTILAIVVACLGTFGLISFTAERKSKEIGIRKVLGASVGNVSFLLIREFMVLLVIAGAIAIPLTWYFMKGWVDGFIYRISVSAAPFVVATVMAALIVILTTGFRAVRAALVNPVDSLRSE
jgi:putative ABC transport system permease protein